MFNFAMDITVRYGEDHKEECSHIAAPNCLTKTKEIVNFGHNPNRHMGQFKSLVPPQSCHKSAIKLKKEGSYPTGCS